MTFNGLKGSQHAAYNYLLQADLTRPIPVREIADVTCYADQTIRVALRELENMQLIRRHRPYNWQPYHYQVLD